jgi:BirA family biotin operon repressor/biotin-[acetyl-CoA-carboxylase] ligase
LGDVIEDLAPARIAARLATRVYGRSLEVRESTESTNDDARRAAAEGAPRGHLVVADAQTRGRGARGRTWSSPAGADLYVSIVERVPVPADRLAPLTLAVGLGVADAIARSAPPLEPRVKWPNDVWVAEKKCAGILVEASSTGGRIETLVIGIGLGVNRTEWDPELAPIATSLRAARGMPVDRADALAALLACVERWVDRFAAEGAAPVVEALEARLALRGERVRCDGAEGVLLGVSASGAARIETATGVRELIAGTLRRAT